MLPLELIKTADIFMSIEGRDHVAERWICGSRVFGLPSFFQVLSLDFFTNLFRRAAAAAVSQPLVISAIHYVGRVLGHESGRG